MILLTHECFDIQATSTSQHQYAHTQYYDVAIITQHSPVKLFKI